jgi:hypothetical protein
MRRFRLVTDRRPARQPPPEPRHPAVGLSLLVPLAMVALFVAWVSAEPFWLAVGHHDAGTVEVTRCTGRGEIGTRCVGTFSPQDRGYAVAVASVSGVQLGDRKVGRKLPASMVSERGRIAYAGEPTGLHVRWLTGLALLLLTGFGIATATGAWRLRDRDRVAAVLLCLTAPLLLATAVLAVAY